MLFRQETAYRIRLSLVGTEVGIRDRSVGVQIVRGGAVKVGVAEEPEVEP